MFYTVIVAVVGLAFLYEYWPRTRAQEFSKLHREWTDDCRRRGLTPEQQSQERNFRLAWARLRRRASEAAMEWPAGHAQKLAAIAKEEATGLALIDKDCAKRFLRVVNDAALSDILDRDAHAAVVKEARTLARSLRSEVSDDLLAALRRE